MNWQGFGVAVFLLLLDALCVTSQDQRCYLNMTVYRHAPCSRNLGPLRPLITLPSSSETYIQEDHGCGCFKISGGRVRIAEPGFGDENIQVHLDMRIGGSSVPQECTNSSASGCGGFGSCVHCDVCESVQNANKKDYLDIVSIRKNGRKIHCGYKLQPGYHRDITLSICLPPKKKLLSMLADNPKDAQDIWNTFFRRNQGGSQTGVPFVIFARTFTYPINHLSKGELRKRLYGPKHEGMVGCHWMYGLITDNALQQPPSSSSSRRGTGRSHARSSSRFGGGSSTTRFSPGVSNRFASRPSNGPGRGASQLRPVNSGFQRG